MVGSGQCGQKPKVVFERLSFRPDLAESAEMLLTLLKKRRMMLINEVRVVSSEEFPHLRMPCKPT